MKNKELSAQAEKELSGLTDQELLAKFKKMRSFSITNAFIIGLLIGILVYSFAKSSWGLLTLIPLYLVFRIANDPKNIRFKVLERLLRERNLK